MLRSHQESEAGDDSWLGIWGCLETDPKIDMCEFFWGQQWFRVQFQFKWNIGNIGTEKSGINAMCLSKLGPHQSGHRLEEQLSGTSDALPISPFFGNQGFRLHVWLGLPAGTALMWQVTSLE